MKNLHTLTYSNKKILLPIIHNLKMMIEIEKNPFGLPLDDFFSMAARINKKRSFLFVSKLLGKHIPINPKLGLLTGFLLACRYEEIVTNKISDTRDYLLHTYHQSKTAFRDDPFIKKEVASPIIIGFAETATALGHSFFQAFQQAIFFHTTRELANELSPIISFEEEHSHATSHRCYVDETVLNNDREIILVDDELTTGKTAINIIRDIQKKYPRNRYTVVSLLDWRSDEHLTEMKKLEEELQITIQSVCLLKGKFTLIEDNFDLSIEYAKEDIISYNPTIEYISLENYLHNRLLPLTSTTQNGRKKREYYLKDTGRFGIEKSDVSDDWIHEVSSMLKEKRIGKTLCIGTGEFMYIPMKIASLMGEELSFQSSTRSPIFPNNEEHYGAKTAISFANPEDPTIVNYLYNIEKYMYDDIFLFFERKVEEKDLQGLIERLKESYIKKINIVYCSGR